VQGIKNDHLDTPQKPLSQALLICNELGKVAKLSLEEYKKVLKSMFTSPLNDLRRVSHSIYDALTALSNINENDEKEEISRQSTHVFSLHQAALEMQQLIELHGLDVSSDKDDTNNDQVLEKIASLPRDSLEKKILEQGLVAENLLNDDDDGDQEKDVVKLPSLDTVKMQKEKREKELKDAEGLAESARFEERSAQIQLRTAAENMASISKNSNDSVENITEANEHLSKMKIKRIEAERNVEEQRTLLKMVELELKRAQDRAHATAHGAFITKLKDLSEIGKTAFEELELNLSKYRDALAVNKESFVQRRRDLEAEKMAQLKKGASVIFEKRNQLWMDTVESILGPMKMKYHGIKADLEARMTRAQTNMFSVKPVLASKLQLLTHTFDVLNQMESQLFYIQRLVYHVDRACTFSITNE